jgi:hypothetical protein
MNKYREPFINKYRKLEYLWIPKPVLLQIIKSGYLPALTVLVVLYETCYLDLEHNNPVTLTSESLGPYQVSRGQKYRALQALEKYGAISVDRSRGKNPKVALNWHLPWG